MASIDSTEETRRKIKTTSRPFENSCRRKGGSKKQETGNGKGIAGNRREIRKQETGNKKRNNFSRQSSTSKEPGDE